MARPPQHSVTAHLGYITKSDPAWDSDRFAKELDELADDEAADHPIVQYFQGSTRYDLDAPGLVNGEPATAREYLREDVRPVVFLWRRLRVSVNTQVRDLPTAMGQEMALRHGLVGIENQPEGMSLNLPKKGRPLGDSHVQEIADFFGMDTIYEVGRAIVRGSSGPTRAEGKPSGS